MKREMDLVRELALRIEALSPRRAANPFYPDSPELAVDGYTPDQIRYHYALMLDGGLVDGYLGADQHFGCYGLTWAGCDFLDSVREPKIWRATTEGLKKAGGFTLDMIVALAKDLIKRELAAHTGMHL